MHPTVPEAASGVVETLSRLADDQLALSLARVRATAAGLQLQVALGVLALASTLASLALLTGALAAGLATLLPFWAALSIAGGTHAVFAVLCAAGVMRAQQGASP